MNTLTKLCAICTQKAQTSYLRRIQLLQGELQRLIPERISAEKIAISRLIAQKYSGGFEFSTNLHCRYGMSCPSLDQINHKCTEESRDLPLLIAQASLYATTGQMRSIMRLMGGYFPLAYQYTERVMYCVNKEKLESSL